MSIEDATTTSRAPRRARPMQRRSTARHPLCHAGWSIAVLAWLAGRAALAQDDGPLWERWSFDAGPHFSEFDADLRVDAPGDAGTTIDLAEDLGLGNDEDVFQARLSARFGRHQVALRWYQLEVESNDVVLRRSFEFEGATFPVDAVLSARLEHRNVELAYTAWVVQRPRGGLGLSLGVVAFRIEAALEATFRLFGLEVQTLEAADTEVPVPMLGFEARGLLHPRLVLLGHVRYLPSIEIDDFQGESTSASIGLEGRVVKFLRVGVAYELFELAVDEQDSSFAGSLDWNVDGPRLYARLLW